MCDLGRWSWEILTGLIGYALVFFFLIALVTLGDFLRVSAMVSCFLALGAAIVFFFFKGFS
jgi:hypothetical protein